MMRGASLIAFTAIALSGASAFAQDAGSPSNFYVGFFGGATYFNEQEIEEGGAEAEIEYDFPGYVFGGQLGYALGTNIRLEGEVAYGQSEGEVTLEVLGIELADANYDLSLLTATGAIYFDLWPLGAIVPYVGAGIGYAYVENEVNDIEDTQHAFTAFGEGGIPMPITPDLALVPAIRFSWVRTEEDADEVFADNLFGTQARLGVRYQF